MLTEQQSDQVGQGIYPITEGVGAPEAVINDSRSLSFRSFGELELAQADGSIDKEIADILAKLLAATGEIGEHHGDAYWAYLGQVDITWCGLGFGFNLDTARSLTITVSLP